jgi:capsular exopolysaccharide synthesis family protein
MNKKLPVESNSGNSVGTETGFNIDYKRVLYHIFKYWYLVALSLLTAITIAFLNNRYAIRVFPITASIIIKEAEDNSEGKLLYNNPLVNFYRNYLNELYIVKSYPLIQNTIKNLHFQVGFYKEGNILTTESYYNMPIRARVLKEVPDARGFSVYFQGINSDEYVISPTEGSKITFAGTYHYGDTLIVGPNSFLLEKIADVDQTFFKDPFILRYTPSSSLASIYIARLNANWAEEGAGVINLSINGSIPQKEIDFLNALIQQYEGYNLTKKSLAATRTIEFISEQLEGISDSLKRVEKQLERFKNKNIVTDLNSEALRLYQKVEGLETQKTELILRTNYYKYLQEYLERDKNLDQIILPSSVGISDNILTGLLSKMVDFQMEMKMHLSGEKLDNPLIVEKRRRIHQIKLDIVESINNQKGVDNIKMNFLNKGIADIEKQLNYLPIADRQLISIKRNYSLLDNLYVFLMQKKAEAGISKASTTSDVVVVNPPLAGGFVSPKIRLNYLLAISFGLAIPLIVFVALELLNTKVQSREDIEEQTDVPILGGTGHKKSEGNLEVMSKPKSSVAESFRALRSNLFYFMDNKEKGVFLVTSSISGEGKTFTSINLASVFALSGKKTLIIGADMRKPKIFEDFKLMNEVGLSSYLAGLAEFEEVFKSTAYDNLFLVSGGPVPPNPSELILSRRMEEFMKLAKDRFDIVIIDSPPLAIVADAFELAKFADHTIFLVRQDYTPKVLLRTIHDFHQNGKMANMSIVLNDIYRSGLGYGYGYGYTYGYGYGHGYYNKKKSGYGYYSD